MRRSVRNILILFALFSCTSAPDIRTEPVGENNMAYKWGKISLQCTANDTENFKPRPTVTSRILGLVWTAVFDAWSIYDEHATPLYLNANKRPVEERSLKNKEIAISFAAFRTLSEYYFSDSILLRKKMEEFGFDPDDTTLDPSTPQGIGNLAAKAVIDSRLDDGSNQRGAISIKNSALYADYTNYVPVNHPDTLRDLQRWQPKYFKDDQGGQFAPSCLTPHWGKVEPLALDSASQFRPIPPPSIGSRQLINEIEEVVQLQGDLTPEQKALVEFMRDGPRSVQQAGHWFIFAQNVSQRDRHTLDDDVKMYFLVQATAMDAFIAAWDAKMHYDFARPYTLIHDHFRGKKIKGWAGPDIGTIEMNGEEWRPYSPDNFLCPPFPAYVSGHSCVSAACAEALRLFTGDDHFGETVKWLPGSLTEPGLYKDSVELEFSTFTETAELAGISRVLGGYHIQADNVEGLKLGRLVARRVWQKYAAHTGEVGNVPGVIVNDLKTN